MCSIWLNDHSMHKNTLCFIAITSLSLVVLHSKRQGLSFQSGCLPACQFMPFHDTRSIRSFVDLWTFATISRHKLIKRTVVHQIKQKIDRKHFLIVLSLHSYLLFSSIIVNLFVFRLNHWRETASTSSICLLKWSDLNRKWYKWHFGEENTD